MANLFARATSSVRITRNLSNLFRRLFAIRVACSASLALVSAFSSSRSAATPGRQAASSTPLSHGLALPLCKSSLSAHRGLFASHRVVPLTRANCNTAKGFRDGRVDLAELGPKGACGSRAGCSRASSLCCIVYLASAPFSTVARAGLYLGVWPS